MSGDWYNERAICGGCGKPVDWSRRAQNEWWGIDFYRGWESMHPEDCCMICEVCIGKVKEAVKKSLPLWDRWDENKQKHRRFVRNIKRALDL